MLYHLDMTFQTSSVHSCAMRRSPFALCLASALSVATVLPSAGIAIAADGANLLAHRAVYNLSLERAEPDSGIDGAAGLFIFQATGSACAGWAVESTLVLTMRGQSGRQQQTRTTYSAFEEPGGARFFYESTVESDGAPPEESHGEAICAASGALSIEGQFRETVEGGDLIQRTIQTDAPEETLFPNALTAFLLDAAQSGDALLFGTVFDGTHDDGLAQPFTASIAPATAPTVLEPIRARRQSNVEGGTLHTGWDDFPTPSKAWPVTLRYFNPDEPDSGPSFTVSYTLDTNGVSDNVVLAYDAFSLRGTLSDFEAFRPEPCPN